MEQWNINPYILRAARVSACSIDCSIDQLQWNKWNTFAGIHWPRPEFDAGVLPVDSCST